MTVLDVVPLEAARQQLEVTLKDLWDGYFQLGGSCSLVKVQDHMCGGAQLPGIQHDILVHALNELFLERDMNHPLKYSRP